MPPTVGEGALLGAGMFLAGAATFFYRRKRTLPFKVGTWACDSRMCSTQIQGGFLILAGGVFLRLAHAWCCHSAHHAAQRTEHAEGERS